MVMGREEQGWSFSSLHNATHPHPLPNLYPHTIILFLYSSFSLNYYHNNDIVVNNYKCYEYFCKLSEIFNQ